MEKTMTPVGLGLVNVETLSTTGDIERAEGLSLNEKEISLNEDEETPVPSSMPSVSPYIIIPIWISLSGGLIIFNKWILTSKGFSFPLFLTAFHMAVAMLGTNLLRYTTKLLDSAAKPVSTRIWTHTIIPSAILYAFSLVLSNIAYVHLSVPFIQMIKASTPVLLQLISYATGLAKPDRVMGVILISISIGCAIATTGELWYDTFGLMCQLAAVVAEASRLLVLQVMLRDIKLNPLVSLYYYAPTCLIFISIALPFMEGAAPFMALSTLGWPILLVNGLMAFALNVSSVLLISSAGSMVSTLSGVVKDIILIVLSVVALGAVVTGQQIFGYGIALIGLVAYRNKEKIESWIKLQGSDTNRDITGRSIFSPLLFSPRIETQDDTVPLWDSKRNGAVTSGGVLGRIFSRRWIKLAAGLVALVTLLAVAQSTISGQEIGDAWQDFWGNA